MAIEALLDVGSFIISREGWSSPSSYQEVGRKLAEHGLIGIEEGKRLSSMAGLRNVLVHLYAEIDYELLYSLLSRAEEMEDLMRKLLDYMEARGIDP